ncbi:hypothetical protein CN085_27600 [Sinorhizobium meliloti]|nr:hypothetical protein CN085_27600 [Sinorhizobium meliloti]
MSAAVAAEAFAWTRNAHIHGRRGTASVHASGSCDGRSCSREITGTGPHGNSVSRQGDVSCANGACTGTRTTTGPQGRSVTRSATVSR